MKAPDLTECIVGYRAFTLGRDYTLRSTGIGAVWLPGGRRAMCLRDGPNAVMFSVPPWRTDPERPEDHDAPHADCQCGYYGMHRIDAIGEHVGNVQVYAAIKAWGEVEVHHDGFRAEWASLIALAPGQARRDHVVTAAKLYGVPVVTRHGLPAVAREHGSLVPESLRPAAPEPDPEDTSRPLTALMRGLLPRGYDYQRQVHGNGITERERAEAGAKAATEATQNIGEAMRRLKDGLRRTSVTADEASKQLASFKRAMENKQQGSHRQPPQRKRAPRKLGPSL